MVCPVNSYFCTNLSLITQWIGASVCQSLHSMGVLSPGENVTDTLGQGCLLASKGPQGSLGQSHSPGKEGS